MSVVSGDKNARMHKRLFALLLVAMSSAFLGIMLNVYLHELGHYFMAEHFDLNPSMHFTAGSNENAGVFSLLLSQDFKAYVRFDAPDVLMKDLLVTAAGPIVNLIIIVSLLLGNTFIIKKLKKNKNLYKKYFWNFLLLDAIFISLLVPSILSFIINMSPIVGSDGSVIYELIRTIFFK
jgi:Zn-dependent protease